MEGEDDDLEGQEGSDDSKGSGDDNEGNDEEDGDDEEADGDGDMEMGEANEDEELAEEESVQMKEGTLFPVTAGRAAGNKLRREREVRGVSMFFPFYVLSFLCMLCSCVVFLIFQCVLSLPRGWRILEV